jgi:hypothetical protein
VSFSWLSFGTKQPLFGAAFSHLKICDVTSNSTSPRNTAVYVDGYNLYYGRLRGTAFKWLDLVKLFDDLLIRRDQNEKLAKVLMPIRPVASGIAAHRRPSGSLSKQADWTLAHLSDDVLAAAQLPDTIPTKKKPIRKPAHW